MHEILKNRSVIEIKGKDTLPFLQNLITNDIVKGEYIYSYMLSNQGRYLFDFFILKTSDTSCLLDIAKTNSDAFIAKLTSYKLRAKVQFLDISDQYSVIYINDILPAITFVKQDPRYKKLGYRAIVENSVALGNDTHDLYRGDKYNYCIPDGEIDLIENKSIAAEYGAEDLSAVSYTKGCYVGQEVMARVKYQGTIRKKLFRLVSDRSLSEIAKGERIFGNDTEIGAFCSGYKNFGICLIREEEYLNTGSNNVRILDIDCKVEIPEWRQ